MTSTLTAIRWHDASTDHPSRNVKVIVAWDDPEWDTTAAEWTGEAWASWDTSEVWADDPPRWWHYPAKTPGLDKFSPCCEAPRALLLEGANSRYICRECGEFCDYA